MKKLIWLSILAAVVTVSCDSKKESADTTEMPAPENVTPSAMIKFDGDAATMADEARTFNIQIPETGRYQVTFYGSCADSCTVWLEDYINNPDDRTYNITGTLHLSGTSVTVDGSPLGEGDHPMRLHTSGSGSIDSIGFELMYAAETTPDFYEQNMEGQEWEPVWSDEFEGEGLPDDSKWTYNVGNWGWGNNEPQYYTDSRVENARQENGTLIIEARKNDMGQPWTSARLTTQDRAAFTYGKIEFRAKVAQGRGAWAAGWLLGDAYRDEISWPYCGEIDVLETVGYEIDDESGHGKNHATCHTRAYYFKQGNQIGSEIEIDSMHTQFHTYAIEWYPDRIEGYLDGEHYYTYDKNADELEWPFNNPQAIILNLAVGGGWGGLQGIDESYDSHQYILDYVRVYRKK